MGIRRNLSDPESRAFWESVTKTREKAAAMLEKENPLSGGNEFSVYQFFRVGQERTKEFVSPEEAVAEFIRLTRTLGAKIGTTKRVIITDGGDCLCAEWLFGKGVTDLGKDDEGRAWSCASSFDHQRWLSSVLHWSCVNDGDE